LFVIQNIFIFYIFNADIIKYYIAINNG